MISFKATPYKIKNWTVLRLPAEASAKLPSRGQVMVKGAINGFGFQTALEPDGRGGHWLNIDKTMQKSANTAAGETATLEIEPTKDWPEPDIPADIKKGLADNPKTQALWMDVTPMARWEWIRWINSTGNAATREHRIEVSASKLVNGLRRPCCFNRNMCCVPDVSKSGVLLDPLQTTN
ncbi:MAG TPA: YdeI/OmpD-associated family protein [Nitrososphaera sp.]|nr:YdeI/OmpD-associated family protein [Nitrososphaera sp.]